MHETTKEPSSASNVTDPRVRFRRAGPCSLVVAGLLAMTVAGPVAALAADPSAAQYATKIDKATAAAATPAADGSAAAGQQKRLGILPFTGADLVTLAMVAVALVGVGLVLHRFSTPKQRV
jgi:hypothetical protein